MDLHLEPARMRAAWRHGEDADAEARSALAHADDARDHDLDALTPTVGDAARDLRGVVEVVRSVLAEHGQGMEDCIADVRRTDGASAGVFRGVLP